jgi:hypothetical protein
MMNDDESKRNRLSTADVAAAGEREKSTRPNREEFDESVPLFEDEKAEAFQSRWMDIQTRFVDDPKDSVRDADELVAEVIQDIAETFAMERSYLEDQWNQGSEASTEDLRVALTRYRSFFNRLLTMAK